MGVPRIECSIKECSKERKIIRSDSVRRGFDCFGLIIYYHFNSLITDSSVLYNEEDDG